MFTFKKRWGGGEGREKGRRREGGREGRGDDNYNQHGKKTLGAEVSQLGSRTQASVPYVCTFCLPIVCLLITHMDLLYLS